MPRQSVRAAFGFSAHINCLARPSGAGDMLGDSGEGAISAAVIFKGTVEHNHFVDLAMPCAREPRAGFDGWSSYASWMALIFCATGLLVNAPPHWSARPAPAPDIGPKWRGSSMRSRMLAEQGCRTLHVTRPFSGMGSSQ